MTLIRFHGLMRWPFQCERRKGSGKTKNTLIPCVSILCVMAAACSGGGHSRRTLAVPSLGDFLSNHTSGEKVVTIKAIPDGIYLEEGRNATDLDFDFVISGKSDRKLRLQFLKVAAYDARHKLLTFRFVNHNGMNPSIRTLGKWTLSGKETISLYNPFHSFPTTLDIKYLRYMFTFVDQETKEEFYLGNVLVRPSNYVQQTRLEVPLKGLLVVLDGHDYYSHHRRFNVVVLKKATQGQILRNFSRYSIDLVRIGANGHLRNLKPADLKKRYDFHVADARAFHCHGAEVFAPGDGTVVDVVNNLPDLYKEPFNLGAAIQQRRLKDMAGNLVVIKHNASEYSHLFHLLKGSIVVKKGQRVRRGDLLGKIGFSGAATTYVHLHYQLMDGQDPLNSRPLPFRFSNVTLVQGDHLRQYKMAMVDTGDFILN